MKEVKTNAMRFLDKHQVEYQVHTYPHHGNEAVDGVTVATYLNQPVEQVFKTLITQAPSRNYHVLMIPVAQEVDLKKAAREASEKSLELIPVKNLLAVSGYIRGGCSPLGMKKQFDTLIDETALLFDTIIFSAGQIGCQIEMNPETLSELIPLRFADLTRE